MLPKINSTMRLASHPEISGICEGQMYSTDTNNGKILVRINIKDLSDESRKFLKTQKAINPNSDKSVIYLFNLSDLKLVEQTNGNGKKRKAV